MILQAKPLHGCRNIPDHHLPSCSWALSAAGESHNFLRQVQTALVLTSRFYFILFFFFQMQPDKPPTRGHSMLSQPRGSKRPRGHVLMVQSAPLLRRLSEEACSSFLSLACRCNSCPSACPCQHVITAALLLRADVHGSNRVPLSGLDRGTGPPSYGLWLAFVLRRLPRSGSPNIVLADSWENSLVVCLGLQLEPCDDSTMSWEAACPCWTPARALAHRAVPVHLGDLAAQSRVESKHHLFQVVKPQTVCHRRKPGCAEAFYPST